MHLFDEDDDYMVTTPKENFFSILENANRNIVNLELEKLIERLAVAEKILEENGLADEWEREIKSMPVSDPEGFENIKNSIFIETVGEIVTKCE
jgi:hypothetical protein